jgi:hypothetical protein
VDVGHPALAPLLPYLPASGAWAWVRDAPAIADARRLEHPFGAVVLGGRCPAAFAT